MFHMFREGNPYDQYQPRKLRKDTDGCLAMGMPGAEYLEGNNGIMLANGGKEIQLLELREKLTTLNSPAAIREYLFFSEHPTLVVCIETCWTYLYLCAESSVNAAEALANTESAQSVQGWSMKKELDIQIVHSFYEEYENIIG